METLYIGTVPLQDSLDRLYYLRDVVMPYLENMPTIEDVTDHAQLSGTEHEQGYEPDYELEYYAKSNGLERKQGVAVLNFNAYCQNNTPLGFEQVESTEKYNCSREGCLAGWYVFMRDQDKTMDEAVLGRIADYSITRLAEHFNINSGAAQMLFGSLLKGCEGLPDDVDTEDTLWSTSQLNVTKIALEERQLYLDKMIKGREAQVLALTE